jgi:hypothetical protein
MTTSLTLALLLITAADGPEISTSIARLGSPRAAERHAAAAALEAAGRAALPALRAASRESRDAEVRSRAAKLLAKVEHDILTRPTMVTLDVRDRTVGEAIQALGETNHFDLSGDLDTVRENLLRKISLREEKPVPLLTALDRLCATGGLRFGYGVDSPFAPPKYFFSNPLAFTTAGTPGPASDSGPFRVQIVSVGYTLQRSRFLDRQAGQDDERFLDERSWLLLRVMAEPRLMLRSAGDAKVSEANDDRGVSLILPPDPNEERGPNTDAPDAIFDIRIDLKPQRRDGGAIKRLRGSIPIHIVELRPEPITLTLAGSQGKSFDGPDATLTVQSLQLDPMKQKEGMSFELRVRSKFEDLDVEPDKPAEPGSIPPVPDSVPFLMRQVVLLDEKGRAIPSWGTGCTRIGPKEARLHSSPVPFEESHTIPAKLLFYGLIRTTAEIPFEFRDVPLP